jgi:hypothetical protein
MDIGCSDMPLFRQIDINLDQIPRSLPLTKRLTHASIAPIDPSSYSLNLDHHQNTRVINLDSNTTPMIGQSFFSRQNRTASIEIKHDTRVVNEAFQDAVAMLEEGFNSKMQAEMLVLVDVLHTPASIFPASSAFRQKSQDKQFIGK